MLCKYTAKSSPLHICDVGGMPPYHATLGRLEPSPQSAIQRSFGPAAVCRRGQLMSRPLCHGFSRVPDQGREASIWRPVGPKSGGAVLVGNDERGSTAVAG